MLTVVKVGGGLDRIDALTRVCATLAELGARHRLLVVPGGAWFADAVRAADRRFGLEDATAHRMAILGMEQFGLLLRDLLPGGPPVVMPAGLALGELPESWDVTSDSIAAWVAGDVGADRLVLVKAPAGPRSWQDCVDVYLPTLLERATFETWLIGPDRLAELFESGTTVGTRIVPGRLLP